MFRLIFVQIGMDKKMPSFLNDLIVSDAFSQNRKEGLMSGKAAKVVITEMQMTILKNLRDPKPGSNDSSSEPKSF